MPLALAAPGSSNGERHRPNLNAWGESALGDHSDRCAHHDRRRGSCATWTFLYSVPPRRACRSPSAGTRLPVVYVIIAVNEIRAPRSPSPCAHENHAHLPSQTLASDCAACESMRSCIRTVISLRWASGWHVGLTSIGQDPLIFQNVSPAPSSVKRHQFRLLARLSTVAECRQYLSGWWLQRLRPPRYMDSPK